MTSEQVDRVYAATLAVLRRRAADPSASVVGVLALQACEETVDWLARDAETLREVCLVLASWAVPLLVLLMLTYWACALLAPKAHGAPAPVLGVPAK